jgi:hypothetical protein
MVNCIAHRDSGQRRIARNSAPCRIQGRYNPRRDHGIPASRNRAVFVLLALANTYLVTKRFDVRRPREQIISSTLQNQVTEQQSFIDPLTEIYNRVHWMVSPDSSSVWRVGVGHL